MAYAHYIVILRRHKSVTFMVLFLSPCVVTLWFPASQTHLLPPRLRNLIMCRVKVKFTLEQANGGRWSTPRSGHFTPGNEAVSIVKEAGWTPGPVWTGAENLAPTGIRSPDRPARIE
jgi:hypothetical protein